MKANSQQEKKKFTIMTAILTFLVVLYFFVNDPFGLFEKGLGSGQALFPKFNAESATRIELIEGRESTVLVKENEVWLVLGKNISLENVSDAEGDRAIFAPLVEQEISSLPRNERYEANQSSVSSMLDRIGEFSEKKIISRQKENFNRFKVGSQFELAVRVFGAADSPSAAFIIGKSGSDFMSQYLRRMDDDKVLVVDGSLLHQFRKPIRDWRDKTIHNLLADDLVSFSWTTKDGDKLELNQKSIQVPEEKADSAEQNNDQAPQMTEKKVWMLGQSEAADAKQATEASAKQMVNTFARLKASDFIDSAEQQEYNLEQAEYSFQAKSSSGAQYNLSCYGKKIASENEYVVKKSGSDQLFVINKSDFDNLTKSVEDLTE